MDNTKIARINELAKLSKQRALTSTEREEQDRLRKEYIAEWRLGAQQVLDHTYAIGPDGIKRKLQKKK